MDVQNLEKEILELRRTLSAKENELLMKINENEVIGRHSNYTNNDSHRNNVRCEEGNKLPKWAIERYSRQILLPDIGVPGQEKLCQAKVLIVGAGGLGCPAGAYLAGAGVGEIGIVDYDTVDLTNIHRQILHGEVNQNSNKVDSAAGSMRRINSRIKVTPYNVQLDSNNAISIISKYDVVLDCTDNVPTRYLLNDACVLTKLPLISGSALKMEGQLTIYGYRAEKNTNEKDPSYIGPCYRCVFPSPPPPAAVGSCSANGVAGPIPGVIGTLQALEAIKYIVGNTCKKLLVERLLLFDGEDITFRTVKLRPKSGHCDACSETPTLTELYDYESFCQSEVKEKDLDLKILPFEHRITAQELALKLDKCTGDQSHLLVDVRNDSEFNMCRIDGAVNYPIEALSGDRFVQLVEHIKKCAGVTFVCRRGNDSQIAAKRVIDVLSQEHVRKVTDLTGGLHAWASDVDHNFPVY